MARKTILVMELSHYPSLIHICIKLFNLKETKNKKLNRFYNKKNIKSFRWKNFPWKKAQPFCFKGAFYNKNER